MSIRLLKAMVCVIVLAYSTPMFAAGTKPVIDRLSHGSNGIVKIHGKHFGSRCNTCEVLVRYSRSLRYSVPIKRWSDSAIVIELPDLNQNEETLRLQVKNSNAISGSKSIRLKRQYSVIKSERRTHSLAVGDKGEDKFKIKSSAAMCGKENIAFDHAEIEFVKRRFADAQIVSSPPAGCERCKPVVVRWYHEPTGSLTYVLKLIGRVVQGVCEKQLRNNS
jgi:hypothetical protein